jgi:DNA-binding transcriptional MerR regulator
MKNPYKYRTKDVCEALGITRMTLYTWEKEGKFTPPRNSVGYRVFTKEQIQSILKSFLPGGKGKWHFTN